MGVRDPIRQAAVNALATLSDDEMIVMANAISQHIFLFNDNGSNTIPGDWQQAPNDPLHCRMLDSAAAFYDATQALISMDPSDGRSVIRQDAEMSLSALDSEERDATIMAVMRRIFVSDSVTGESMSNSWYDGIPNTNFAFWTSSLAVRDIYTVLFSLG